MRAIAASASSMRFWFLISSLRCLLTSSSALFEATSPLRIASDSALGSAASICLACASERATSLTRWNIFSVISGGFAPSGGSA